MCGYGGWATGQPAAGSLGRSQTTSTSTVRLGSGVKLPEPFSFTLETESFAV